MLRFSSLLRRLLLLSLVVCAVGASMQAAPAAELKLQLGHSEAVNSVVFSPDGRFILTGSNDRTARLWDVASGGEIGRFEGHARFVTSVAFSPGWTESAHR